MFVYYLFTATMSTPTAASINPACKFPNIAISAPKITKKYPAYAMFCVEAKFVIVIRFVIVCLDYFNEHYD